MSKHRQAARVDSNQRAIVRALRLIPGVTVAVGHDDILVGYAQRTFWFEIKRPETVSPNTGQVRASERKQSQRELAASWCGQYAVVWSLEQIIDILAQHGTTAARYREIMPPTVQTFAKP